MSTRVIELSTEWDADIQRVIVVIDFALEDNEPAQLAERIEEERGEDDDDGEPFYFGTKVDEDEAEILGQQWIEHARLARYLNGAGIDGPFSWEHEEDGGLVLAWSDDAKRAVASGESMPKVQELILFARCTECERVHHFGRLADLSANGKPFRVAWDTLTELRWTAAAEDGALCATCNRLGDSRTP